jgi:hypothetical protein
MGTRIFPALRVVEKHLDSRKKEVDIMGNLTEDQKLYFDNFLYLTAALRIVSSNSMAPIPPVSLVFHDHVLLTVLRYSPKYTVHATELPSYGCDRRAGLCRIPPV